MRRAIVIQHVAMEGPERIADLCREREIPVEVRAVHAGAPVPAAVAADEILIVMGGGMGVGDRDDPRYPFLNEEIALLGGALRDGRAVLGVCLGAQLLARAAGARVYPNVRREAGGGSSGAGTGDRAAGAGEGSTTVAAAAGDVPVREVGWGPVRFIGGAAEPALAGLSPEEIVLHWHGDMFDLPAGAVHLAETALCRHQAFRLGARAFALQFHVEATAATTRRWAMEDADFVRAARGPDGPALVIAETERHAAAARVAGDRLLRNILGCMGT
jgi:GMP synthase (glutamine-hydrolysing)